MAQQVARRMMLCLWTSTLVTDPAAHGKVMFGLTSQHHSISTGSLKGRLDRTIPYTGFVYARGFKGPLLASGFFLLPVSHHTNAARSQEISSLHWLSQLTKQSSCQFCLQGQGHGYNFPTLYLSLCMYMYTTCRYRNMLCGCIQIGKCSTGS